MRQDSLVNASSAPLPWTWRLCPRCLFLYLVLVFCLSNQPIQLTPWIVCLSLSSFHPRCNCLDLLEIESKQMIKKLTFPTPNPAQAAGWTFWGSCWWGESDTSWSKSTLMSRHRWLDNSYKRQRHGFANPKGGNFWVTSWHRLGQVFKFCVRLVLPFHILSGTIAQIKHMHV